MKITKQVVVFAIVTLVVSMSLIPICNAGYMKHWSNQETIARDTTTSTSFIVLSAFKNNKDKITIKVQGNIAKHMALSDKEFILGNAWSNDSSKTVNVVIDPPQDKNITSLTGKIIINHEAVKESGGTGIKLSDTIPMNFNIKEETVDTSGSDDKKPNDKKPILMIFAVSLFGLVFSGGILKRFKEKTKHIDDKSIIIISIIIGGMIYVVGYSIA